MRGRVLATALVAMLVGISGTAYGHDELPQELRDALPTAPDGSPVQSIGHSSDEHSNNMLLVGNTRGVFGSEDPYRMGTDIAFWGDLAVAGNYGFPGGFYLIDVADPTKPTPVGQFNCPGPQADVSVWKDLAFVSVDSPMEGPQCGARSLGQTSPQVLEGQAYEGIRVVSIKDRANPTQIAFVDTDCGSHTHTLVPDEANDRLLIYVLSYPLGGQSATDCNAETHRKISVVEVPLKDPAAARVVSTPDVSPAIGCHDVTVLVPNKLAAAACISQSQLWDISDPVNPRIVSHIVNPAINIHHSTTFSNDGRTLVIGDELGGAAVSPGCVGGDEHVPLGALWFYDVSNPALPVPKGTFTIPQQVTTIYCTAHNFNTVPLKSDRDLLVTGWYNGGVAAIDYTDPANPEQLGHYLAKEPFVANVWSAYWYRDFVYANNFDQRTDTSDPDGDSRGFDVFAYAEKGLKADTVKLKRLNPQTMEAFAR